VTPDAVRYYERLGLLAPARRTSSGYRVYDDAVIDRLRLIKGAQRIGLRLREVRELLEILDRGLCPCGHAEVVVRLRLAEIDSEIASLAKLRSELLLVADRLSAGACPVPDAGAWPCEEGFIRVGRG
jgi:DNA-binding transcriptional MerR regulator